MFFLLYNIYKYLSIDITSSFVNSMREPQKYVQCKDYGLDGSRWPHMKNSALEEVMCYVSDCASALREKKKISGRFEIFLMIF